MSDFNGKLVIVKPLVEFILWMHYLYTIYQNASKQDLSKLYNRDFQNFFYCFDRFVFNSLDGKGGEFFRFDCK